MVEEEYLPENYTPMSQELSDHLEKLYPKHIDRLARTDTGTFWLYLTDFDDVQFGLFTTYIPRKMYEKILEENPKIKSAQILKEMLDG